METERKRESEKKREREGERERLPFIYRFAFQMAAKGRIAPGQSRSHKLHPRLPRVAGASSSSVFPGARQVAGWQEEQQEFEVTFQYEISFSSQYSTMPILQIDNSINNPDTERRAPPVPVNFIL